MIQGRLIKPNEIDYSLLRDWANTCTDNHPGCTNPQFRPSKLINCAARKIELQQSYTPYVALSYVWGDAVVGDLIDDDIWLPSLLPATIEDAMKVTVSLGYTHLWIDRYCIDQDDAIEKHDQIQKMDKIFEGADLVIIAAAGDDPHYGLPGVSVRSRIQQPNLSIGKHTFVSIMNDPWKVIQKSKWASRAWTYQEALFARRRLFFTDEQVHYICRTVTRPETICRSIGQDSARHLKGQRVLYSPQPVEEQSWTIFTHITEYTGRELKYDSDALNGVLGIFRHFEGAKIPLHHFWGIPLLTSTRDLSSSDMSSMQGFLFGLCWTLERGGTHIRRPLFPSWSWTGWSSQAKNVPPDGAVVVPPSVTGIKVTFQSNDRVFDLLEVAGGTMASDMSQWSHPRLHVEGRVLEVEMSRRYAEDGSGGYDSIARPVKATANEPLGYVYVNYENPLPQRNYTCLVLMESSKLHYNNDLTTTVLILILVDTRDGEFERGGLIEVHLLQHEDYEKSAWFVKDRQQVCIR
ncbi:MAG: hypothetical protein MMC23_007366 [Stictis urceolatum]|nr:hypothetical protein [Stictis urceolata]